MKDLISEFNERYLTKEEIRFRIPKEVNANDCWEEMMLVRKKTSIQLPLLDQNRKPFWFNITDKIKTNIKIIEDSAKEDLFNNVPSEIEDTIIAQTLIDEAFSSSVIEGAFSTKARTKNMIKNKLDPTDKSEAMILNNYKALQFIVDHIDEPISEEIILSIYNIVTKDALDEEEIVEKYRNGSVVVRNASTQEIIYEGPNHTCVQELIDSLLKFINSSFSVHDIVKASIFHFYFVYIHPFFDGNGRTARALSFMYLIQQNFNFFKFFSISSMIDKERRKYYKAILNSEIYESDMTYFIEYSTSMMANSVLEVKKRFKKEYGRKLILSTLNKLNIVINKRQTKVIGHFIRTERPYISISDYQKQYKISYETARSDLIVLEELGVLRKIKKGKKYLFILNDLSHIIESLYKDFS